MKSVLTYHVNELIWPIMSLASIKMLTNITHMQYQLRQCHVKAILKVCDWNVYSRIALPSSTGTNFGLNGHEDLTYTIQDNATVKPPCKFGGFIG